jgi:hypothetical protein
MKYFSFVFLFLLAGSSVLAQSNSSSKQITHYILEDFQDGTILLKGGEKQQYALNYNSLTEEMVYQQNAKRLAIGNPEKVDTVFLQNRKFIPVGKAFYQVLTATPVALLAQYKATVTKPGVSNGYGTTAQSSSVNSYTNLASLGLVYDLKLPAEYEVRQKVNFWFKKAGQYYKADNVKLVAASFAEKEDAIKKFVKENKTNFNREEDMVKLMHFLFP